MTITARNAHTQLAASSTLLKAIAPRVAQGIGACRQMIDGGGDIEHREDAGVRGKNWITDPTGETAIARMATHERTLEDVEQYLDTIRASVSLLVTWCDRFAPTTVTDHPRCHATGPDSVQSWARADCTDYVASTIRNDGTVSYRGDGLCDRCRQAKAKHERERNAA